MNNLLDSCEVWDLTLSAYPLHSRLYALEPLGVGTPHIESLTSYMTRMAVSHSVSFRTLVIQELLPLLKRDYLSNPFGNSLGSFWIEAARALNGTGALARDWAQVLEHLTLRIDLQFLTLLPWAAVLTQQRLLRIARAWCPDCFMEWQAAGQPIYEPLLWNVSAVSLCLRHQQTLLEQCPYPDCHATLPLLASHFRPGYCSKCLRWLGVPRDPPNLSWTTEQWHWQIWAAETVGEMVSHNMDLTVTPHTGNIPDLIAAFREQVADSSVQNLAERLHLSRYTLNAWKQGRQVPQIESLMRLCYCCGISLYDLFTLRSGTLNSGKLKIRSLPDIPNPTRNRRRRIPLDTVYIQQSLEAILKCEQPPPSMRAVARRLNHSPRELREYFPELCRAISSRYKNYYQVRAERKMNQLKNEVRRAILEIHSQGLYPSSNKVRLLLSEPAVMRDPAISRFWHELLQEMDLEE
ncbi:MAG: TniQ family protein [Chloroflexi bacterium]|nr:TniQ family protein [Chloroflexota bacterium]